MKMVKVPRVDLFYSSISEQPWQVQWMGGLRNQSLIEITFKGKRTNAFKIALQCLNVGLPVNVHLGRRAPSGHTLSPVSADSGVTVFFKK